MPIQDIDDFSQGRGIPLAAKFLKGDEVGNEVPYFRAVPMAGFEHLMPFLSRILGDTPTRLAPVYLLGDTPDEVFTYWMEGYSDSGQFERRCDQHTQVKSPNGKGVPCLRRTKVGQCNCNRRGRLHLRLPSMRTSTGQLLAYMVQTGSKLDIERMRKFLLRIQDVYVEGMGERLSQIPFVLNRVPEEIMVDDGNGDFKSQTHYMIHLGLQESWVRRTEKQSPMPHDIDSEAEALAYLPYLRTVFEKNIPCQTVEDFMAWYGYNPMEFVQTFPVLSKAREMAIEWIYQHNVPLLATRVICKRNGKSWRYDIDCGIAYVSIFSRSLFRDAGFQTDDWQGDGVITQFEDLVPVAIGKTKTTNRYRVDSILQADMVELDDIPF